MFNTLLICIAMLCATPNGTEMDYDPAKPLVWENFTQRVTPSGLFKAFSYTGIRYVVDAPDGKTVEITVTPYFEPEKSWVSVDFMNDHLLNHEQRHFDLTAVHAAILDSALNPLETDVNTFMDQRLITQVEAKFDSVYSALQFMQSQYDKATDHSLKRDVQKQWDEKIDSLKRQYLQ